MLTVREPCDSEYRVRALLLGPRQGVTSLLIGDIRVPAAASYPQFRSLLLLLLLLFNLFTLSPPSPPPLLILSRSSSPRSALISSRQTNPPIPTPRPPPPSLRHPPPTSFPNTRLHFKWWHCARSGGPHVSVSRCGKWGVDRGERGGRRG